MAEVEDAQWQQALNLDAFVRRGLANPKTRRKLLEVQKELNPEIAVPEIDESDPVRKDLADLRSEIQKEREERAEKEQRDAVLTQWNAGIAAARKRGFTDESIEKLHQFMEQHSILEHEAAIPYYEQLNPPPKPAVSSSSRWDFFGQQNDDTVDLKLLYEGKDEQWLDKTVADTLSKVRSGEITR